MREELKKEMEEFKEYFKEDLEAIDSEMKKSEEYSKIIDGEIEKLQGTGINSLGASKGVQHYLTEHIANAVSLQSQRESLRKSKFAIKKAIVDYASKFSKSEGQSDGDLLTEIQKLLEIEKRSVNKEEEIKGEEDIDEMLDDILGEDEENK